MGIKTTLISTVSILALSACTVTAPVHQVQTEAEPQVAPHSTPYDDALACLGNHVNGSAPFITVGRVNDLTGKSAVSDGGSGAYITQGGPDIVMSAVMTAGAFPVVNTQDLPLSNVVAKRNGVDERLAPEFYLAGSINTLDFVPGGGAEVGIAGVGFKAREYSILVGLDMFLVNGRTDTIVRSSKMLKRVSAEEIGVGLTRFFGTTLVDVSAGMQDREALHVALRGMLKYASYDLLSEFADGQGLAENCDQHIRKADGVTDESPAAAAELLRHPEA